MNPFKALYGRNPPLLFKGTTIPSPVEEMNRVTQQPDELLANSKANLLKVKDYMKCRSINTDKI